MSTPQPAARPRTVLITGASSGLGYEFSKLFARDGYQLVLVARDEHKLEAVAQELRDLRKGAVVVIAQDLSIPDAAQAVYDAVQRAGLTVDVLVNNAGYTVFGPFVDTDGEQERGLMMTNMVALTLLTKLFLPGMVARKRGRILNLSSTAAFQAGPLMAVYYASKAYVLSFSEALANEVAGTGVTVTALCPGPTATGFQARGQLENSALIKDRQIASAASVALAGYQAMQRGQTMLVTGRQNQVFAFLLGRVLPRKMAAALIRRVQAEVH